MFYTYIYMEIDRHTHIHSSGGYGHPPKCVYTYRVTCLLGGNLPLGGVGSPHRSLQRRAENAEPMV